MKWKLESPEPGARRIVRKFAWLPVEIEGYKVWLETYETKEVYYKVQTGLYSREYTWVEICHWDHELEKHIFPERKLLHYWI